MDISSRYENNPKLAKFIREINLFVGNKIGLDDLTPLEVLTGIYSAYLMAEWQAARAGIADEKINAEKAKLERLFREYNIGSSDTLLD